MDAAFTSWVAISLRVQSFMSLVPVHKIFFEDTEYLSNNFIIGFIASIHKVTMLETVWSTRTYGEKKLNPQKVNLCWVCN